MSTCDLEQTNADVMQNLTTTALLVILNSTRASDIPGLLAALEPAQQDRLMAYLYKVRSFIEMELSLTDL